jgi:GNAT superfamily N-acetyltransferase
VSDSETPARDHKSVNILTSLFFIAEGATVHEDITVREATAEDIGVVMHHRRSMFLDMGHRDPKALAAMQSSSEPLLKKGLENGTYRGWLAQTPDGRVVAGGGVIVLEFQSHPDDPLPRRGFIVNMYTEPPFRRLGLARRLMETMIASCRSAGWTRVYLHASGEGRPLYVAMGFVPTNEMRLDLR